MNAISYLYNAEVVRVVDGDTVDFSCSLGFFIKLGIRTRLYGIDAPELPTVAGKASRTYLRELLPAGLPVVLTTYRDPLDKYGRWLAKVTLGDKRVVNELLVSQGHAVVKMYRGKP